MGGVKDVRCWMWVPPECPVKVPLSLHAAGVEVRVGHLEGGDGCARVVVSGVEFESVGKQCFTAASTDAISQLAERVSFDLTVGAVVRKIVDRKPLSSGVLGVLVRVLVQEAEGEDEKEVLRGLLSGGLSRSPGGIPPTGTER